MMSQFQSRIKYQNQNKKWWVNFKVELNIKIKIKNDESISKLN